MRISIMKKAIILAVAALFSSSAMSAEELNFYNWVDYTSPALLAKFEKETGIKVNLDTYDSNETLLAKLKSGVTGYDVVVPSQNFLTILISEGMLEKIPVKSMSNYNNIDKRWQNPPWDPNQDYSAPYQMGTTSFSINMDGYDGPGNSLKEFFEPNASVSGKVQVFRTPDEVIPLALMYLGYEQCNENPVEMKEVQKLLIKQKQHVKTYNSETMIANVASGEIMVTSHWDGYSMVNRTENNVPMLKYVHPKEGIIGWFDSLVVPKGAPNKANAEKFINFMMDAKNGANISNHTRYASPLDAKAIAAHIDPELGKAQEINIDPSVPVHFSQTCSPKAIKLYDRVWTKVLQ